MNPSITWRLFAPCRDDEHRDCAERVIERATVVVRCSCDCHVTDEEREEERAE